MKSSTPLAAFVRHRPLLWKLCYRMTGCAADADDLVRDTFARALAKPPADLERELKPWLVQVAMNLSRDQLRKRKRKRYIGPWLPSPIETRDAGDDARPDAVRGHDPRNPELHAYDAADREVRYGDLESVSFAFLCAAEALTPIQRGVLILRDVLAYPIEETAAALALSASNAKTTHKRARAAMSDYDRARVPITDALRARTAQALAELLLHLRAGDARAIQVLLAKDARARNDSNGEFEAARVPIAGAVKIVKYHIKVAHEREAGGRFAMRTLNGLPALIAEFDTVRPRVARRVVFRIELDADGRVRELDTIVASGKLTHVRFDKL